MTKRTQVPRQLSRFAVYARLLIEAIITLIIVQLTITLVPFNRYVHRLTRSDDQHETPIQLAYRLRRTIHIAGRILPWSPKCLARAMTAQSMLARRGYASVLSLGVADIEGALNAHAWLAAGGIIVTGRGEMERYDRIADFGLKRPEERVITEPNH